MNNSISAANDDKQCS